MYTIRSCAIIIYVCMLQKPFGKRFFFCKSYSKRCWKKGIIYLKCNTRHIFVWECHWYGKYIVKKNQYNNDIRAGKNDIRVQGWTILFGTIDMKKKNSFIYYLMNLNKNEKGYRGMTLYTYLVDYYLHKFTV